VFGADQTERVLGAPRAGEEHFRQARRIDGVGGSLRGQERRAPGRKLKRADAGGLRAREDRRGADPRVAEPGVVGERKSGVATIGLSGDRDPRGIDEPEKRARAGAGGHEHPRDHESHVGRLVDEVRLVRTTRSVGVPEREDGRGDHVAGPRPALQQPRIRRRRHGEAMSEDDEREWAIRACGRCALQIALPWRTKRRIANICQERAWLDRPVRELDRAAGVDQSQHAQPDRE